MLVLALFVSGCYDPLNIENNRRVYVTGKIVDIDGNPIPNITVKTEGGNDIIDFTKSDILGNFEMISLDELTDPLSILINTESQFGNLNNDQYSGKVFFSEINNNFIDYPLGNIVLRPMAELNFQLVNNPGDENVLTYSLNIVYDICNVNMDIDGFGGDCQLQGGFPTTLTPNSENIDSIYYSIQGTTAIFEYQLNNDPAQTVEIPLTNPQNTYVFEY